MRNARLLGTLTSSLRVLSLCVLFGAIGVSAPGRAEAGGRNLDGRSAPDMTFSDGLNGVGAGTSLSSFRGRPVYVKFWLRDCPVCRRELANVQQLYDRWGKAGLQVLTVVHSFPSSKVAPTMRQLGYDFPVACDTDGSQARKYGVGSRPATYLIGVDGRVKASNGAPDTLIAQELGHYRLAALGKVPSSLKSVRDAVWQGRMGTALRAAEAAAAVEGAAADVKTVAKRTREVAEETMLARAHWATRQAQRGRVSDATSEFASMRKAFEGTTLASEAVRLEKDFGKRIGG